MRNLFFIILLALLTTQAYGQGIIDVSAPAPYSREYSSHLLDSLGKAPVSNRKEGAISTFSTDSVFYNLKHLTDLLTTRDFNELKNSCREGKATIDFIRRAFKDYEMAQDSTSPSDSVVSIHLFSFDKRKEDFNEFAIALGGKFGEDATVYFFKKNKQIARQDVSSLDLEIKHFKDEEGRTTLYYSQLLDRGSGIWQFNSFFYKYIGDTLYPVLNEIENANLSYSWTIRTRSLQTKIVSTRPLKLQMSFHATLLCRCTEKDEIDLVKKTVVVPYRWDKTTHHYIGEYTKAGLTKDQVLSYDLSYNEWFFFKAYHTHLKQLITKGSKEQGNALVHYLHTVMNNKINTVEN